MLRKVLFREFGDLRSKSSLTHIKRGVIFDPLEFWILRLVSPDLEIISFLENGYLKHLHLKLNVEHPVEDDVQELSIGSTSSKKQVQEESTP